MNRIALTFLSILTVGCTVFGSPYHWERTGHACASYSWTKVDASRIGSFCGPYNTMPGKLAGCRLGTSCAVVSVFSEEEAKTVIAIDGMTVYDHEQRHLNGENHQ